MTFGTLSAGAGGTGFTTYAVGDILSADTTTTLSRIADVSVGSYLRSGGVGVLPLWSTLKLVNAATTGDLFSASATDTQSRITAVEIGRVLLSQGASTLPAYTAVPVLGLAGTTQGSIGLSGLTSGVLTIATPAATTSWTFTFPATVPANRSVPFFSNATGQFAVTAGLTDGQLVIGSSSGNPAVATLTAGTGIVITNAANAITVATNITGATASTTIPNPVIDQTGVIGTALTYARGDHVHALGPITNNIALRWKDSTATNRDILNVNATDLVQLGNASLDNLRILSDHAQFQAGVAGTFGTFDNFGLNFTTNNVNYNTVTAAGVPSYLISPLNFTAGGVFTMGTTDAFDLAFKRGGTEIARVASAGLLVGITAFSTAVSALQVESDVNATVVCGVQNTSTGTAAVTAWEVGQSLGGGGSGGTTSLVLGYVNSGFTASGLTLPNQGFIESRTGATNGLLLVASGGTAPIKFAIGTTEFARFPGQANPGLALGLTTLDTNFIFEMQKDQNNTSRAGLFNASTGASGETEILSGQSVASSQFADLFYLGSGFTTSLPYVANQGGVLVGTGATGGAMFGTQGNAIVKFIANNAEKMRLQAGGGLSIGTTTDPGNFSIVQTGTLHNFTAGAAATIGTTDNFRLILKANGTNVLQILTGISTDGTDPGTNKLRITGGIDNSNTGFQHKRGSATVAANSTVSISHTWNTAFADTNYTPVCTPGSDADTCQLIRTGTINAGNVEYRYQNTDLVNAHTALPNHIGVHD
jgi:hypothetical protein